MVMVEKMYNGMGMIGRESWEWEGVVDEIVMVKELRCKDGKDSIANRGCL